MRKPKSLLIGLTLLLLLLPTAALAQQGGGYEITGWTVDGGGGSSASDTYTLEGAVGQPDTGRAMIGGPYRMVGGLWEGTISAILSHHIYLPLALRSQ